MTHVQERSARTQPASLKTEETFVGVQSYRQTLEVIVGYRIALLQCQLFLFLLQDVTLLLTLVWWFDSR